ncbi:MAG: N-acetyl-gamma-glutamyl-phosphate reductase [Saprospiraceae bacterium]|nr:MAG: N-acetyl-gamma-glutamyl-phosphate reductase [Saprospiraceae bacterium]
MIKAGIIGATGYTGSELVRLLYRHPEVDITAITSESRKGEAFSAVHGQFRGLIDHTLQSADDLPSNLDIVFLALPHGVSMEYVEKYEQEGFRIVDLSGDFRLSSPEVYQSWYGKPHTYSQGFGKAVYGLPELHKKAIGEAQLVANPGCYPTSAILGLAPLVHHQLIDQNQIIIDSKSGLTGAGIKANATTHFSNVNDNFKAYALKSHRHTVEIEEQLSGQSTGGITVQFTPHLLPVDRGILSTIYATPLQPISEEQLRKTYVDFYRHQPFVRLCDQPPSLKEVRGSNYCDLFVTYDERTQRIIVVAVIDNLVKGAAGQAVHNMNLMFGLEETTGLKIIPLKP